MKRLITVVAAASLFAAGLAGCNDGLSVSQEDAEKAFVVGYVSVIMISMRAAFGSVPDGVTADEENGSLTLRDYDVSEMGMGYESVSGKATSDDASMNVDLTLKGGPVSSLAFKLEDPASQSESIKTTITVNGKKYEVDLDQSDLEGLAG